MRDTVLKISREIAQGEAEALAFADAFAEEAAWARENTPPAVRRFQERIPRDWHQRSPIYYTYPDSLVSKGRLGQRGTLFDTARLIAHARDLGAGSLYVLPVFDSPGGDAGFDVRSWDIKEELGGNEGFDALLAASMDADFPVILDLPLNHLSIEHEWFVKLRAGDHSMAERFLEVPEDWVKTGEKEVEGRTYAVYRDAAGVETLRWIIFPQTSRNHILELETAGRSIRLYHSFYPFQVDVNLRHPVVFRECLRLLSRLLTAGVLGFRLDAIQHWLKRDGTTAENLPETFQFAKLLNLFAKSITSKAKLLPEIGAPTKEAARYFGRTVQWPGGVPGPEISDGIWGFEIRAAIPETVFLRSAEPFWAAVKRLPAEMPRGATILGMVTHHDELPGEYLHAPEKTLPGMISAGGFPFRDGTSVCGRLAPLLGNNSRRLGLAYFLMFVFPRSTPTLYYGEEAGLGNDPAHADREAARRRKILASLGIVDGGEDAAYDARDVHRQVISPQVLEEAAATEDTVAAVFRNLSGLRRKFSALRSHRLPIRLAEDTDSVVAMILLPEEPGARSVVAAANLGETKFLLRVSEDLVFDLGPEEFLLQELDIPSEKLISTITESLPHE